MSDRVDVAVIGAGPAGIAAAVAASAEGASVLLIEREARPGGILKQCVHDGFGLFRFGQRLSGPEYIYREIKALEATDVYLMLQTFVTRIDKIAGGFLLTLTNRGGLIQVAAGSLVLATGCRERTARQVAIHGARPAGVLTAGNAQYYTNILGQMPTKKCVILGSGDIGLIMARRLTLEGAKVIGVFEAKQTPGGLPRNIAQCLQDFDIPLHLGHTVTRVGGAQRLKVVEVCRVDENQRPIGGTEKMIQCDALILSVGLIPENELAESLGVEMCPNTRGPVCDQNNMTMTDGVFTCGNSTHVSDLADYVSESGGIAGQQAARYSLSSRYDSAPQYYGEEAAEDTTRPGRTLIDVKPSRDFLYATPQRIDVASLREKAVLFFRAREVRDNMIIRVQMNGIEVFRKHYLRLNPPEMERIEVDFGGELMPNMVVTMDMERSQ